MDFLEHYNTEMSGYQLRLNFINKINPELK